MSTRIGVNRETAAVSAESREAPDGKVYYDIVVQIKSYATRSQLAVTGAERAQVRTPSSSPLSLSSLYRSRDVTTCSADRRHRSRWPLVHNIRDDCWKLISLETL